MIYLAVAVVAAVWLFAWRLCVAAARAEEALGAFEARFAWLAEPAPRVRVNRARRRGDR